MKSINCLSSFLNLVILQMMLFLIEESYSNALRRWPRSRQGYSYLANDTACTVDDIVYREGDSIPTGDPCEVCRCRPPGFHCVVRDCPVKPGCKAIRREGECCHEYQCGCEYNGKYFNDGDAIPFEESRCYACVCQGSSITCALLKCEFRMDCEPEYIAGECCPRYDHCRQDANDSQTDTSEQFDNESVISLNSANPPINNMTIDQSTTPALLNSSDSQQRSKEAKLSDTKQITADENSSRLIPIIPAKDNKKEDKTNNDSKVNLADETNLDTTKRTTVKISSEYDTLSNGTKITSLDKILSLMTTPLIILHLSTNIPTEYRPTTTEIDSPVKLATHSVRNEYINDNVDRVVAKNLSIISNAANPVISSTLDEPGRHQNSYKRTSISSVTSGQSMLLSTPEVLTAQTLSSTFSKSSSYSPAMTEVPSMNTDITKMVEGENKTSDHISINDTSLAEIPPISFEPIITPIRHTTKT